MASFDSIVVGEDFVSEHFFTTDAKKESFLKAVMDRRKVWDTDDAAGHDSVRARFLGARQSLLAALSHLDEESRDDGAVAAAAGTLRQALGYPVEDGTLLLRRGGRTLSVPHAVRRGPLLVLTARPVASPDELLSRSDGRPLGCITDADTGKPEELSVSQLISEAFLSDDAPGWVLVVAGRWLLLTEGERWPLGRWLAADAQLVADRNEPKKHGEVDHLLAVAAADGLQDSGDGTTWWDGVLEDSVKHTVGVSADLRLGIRQSIEIIANEVLRRRTAAGLSNDDVDGNDLAKQSLRFLYRILFLLYAEASPEMGVLPVGDDRYDQGYGLDRLRELTLADVAGPRAERGTHLFESLALLFALVENGHRAVESDTGDVEGLTFQPLRADLFRPEATALIDDAGLGNAALQSVLQLLLLSREAKGKDRGFISYAELGINQLGAVYEGLMSFTGFIAREPMQEVAKNGDASKGSWVVPVDRAEGIDERHFVRSIDPRTGSERTHHYRAGEFVYRLAGRERQQSASFYTPEVLTKFVVGQALEELLDQDGHTTTAAEVLDLTVCEPALGSGAFAIEAVRQLAAQYLERRQAELGEEIPAELYPAELQKAKASIALHQVYGVDLNSTAVELAEVSLWLDTMVPGLQAPWFGLHLRRGNSLIGARRAMYSAAAVAKKEWLKQTPDDAPLSGLLDALRRDSTDSAVAGRIHHFLLPSEGWGAAADAKEVKDLAGEAQKALKDWRKSVRVRPNRTQLSRLEGLAQRVETLWGFALRRLQVAEQQVRRDIDVFGADAAPVTGDPVSRERIEASLVDENGSYRRLRRVMDAWAALWCWPLTECSTGCSTPPSLDEWLDGLEALLGTPIPETRRQQKYLTEGDYSFLAHANWDEIGGAEDFDRSLSGQRGIDEVLDSHPWLRVTERVAAEQGFFHWELDFAQVFARGGFDLQVGNPPWVRPRSDEAALLAEGDPWWQLVEKPTQAEVRARRAKTLALPGMREDFIDNAVPTPVVAAYLGEISTYPHLQGQQPDLYRAFMELAWRNGSRRGVQTLVHPESHFTEKKAAPLRAGAYRRLRRHWQFINELHLYEIHHLVVYGVHVYAAPRTSPRFVMASSLYHPRTVEESFVHDGSGPAPGLKDDNGKWDVRPHRDRLLTVDETMLAVWAGLLDDPGTPPGEARMVYVVNSASARVLEKLSEAPRVRELGLQFSSGWHETGDRKKGYFEVGSAVPESWDDVILQGPHFTVANPFAKQPNPTMKNNLDWTEIDLEALPDDFIPRTSYQIAGDRSRYDADYTHWEVNGAHRNRGCRWGLKPPDSSRLRAM